MSGFLGDGSATNRLRLVIALLGVPTVIALISLVFLPHDPALRVALPLTPASMDVLLGTDAVGRDLLSRLLLGMALSWLPSLGIVAVSAALGGLAGVLIGMASGLTARVGDMLLDGLRALPAPLMPLAAVAVQGPGLRTLAAALLLFGWPRFARLARRDIRVARAALFGEAVRMTAPDRLFYFVPIVLPALLATAARDIGATVILLSVLTYAGLGAPGQADLGAMAQGGMGFVLDYPRVAVLPLLVVLALAGAATLAGRMFGGHGAARS